MKHLPFVLLLTPLAAFTSMAAVPLQWQCMAMDIQDRSFFAALPQIDNAMAAAVKRCKQESSHPKTCKSAQSFCEQKPISNADRCLVTDDDGHAWDIDGANSCKKALQMCNQFIYLEGGAHGQCWVKHGGEGGNLDVD